MTTTKSWLTKSTNYLNVSYIDIAKATGLTLEQIINYERGEAKDKTLGYAVSKYIKNQLIQKSSLHNQLNHQVQILKQNKIKMNDISEKLFTNSTVISNFQNGKRQLTPDDVNIIDQFITANNLARIEVTAPGKTDFDFAIENIEKAVEYINRAGMLYNKARDMLKEKSVPIKEFTFDSAEMSAVIKDVLFAQYIERTHKK